MKNLKTHLKKVREIENTMMMDIRGFQSLTKEQQELLEDLSAILSNWFGDWEDISNEDLDL